ncbi:MAG: radical SAM protein [Thermoplasmata archaeon]
MGKSCAICGETPSIMSSFLGLCPRCARKPESRNAAEAAHTISLRRFGLSLPGASGARCGQCVNECSLGEGAHGMCGVRICSAGRVVPLAGHEALVDWYYDPLPTNCVAEWVCGAAGSCGSPRAKNLAVFFYGCSFDCLFCQNWTHKSALASHAPRRGLERLVQSVDDDTFCVCFFGGDPTPQAQFALRACDYWLSQKAPSLRICWETNGSMSWGLMQKVASVSEATGGIVKFDIKAFNEDLHFSLCGASNRQTLSNFSRLAESHAGGDKVLLVASTLLVPGYVNAEEVRSIASFIASLDPNIPYSLLAFHPDYMMADLPPTSKTDARDAKKAALQAGLRTVNIGNVHILE